MAGTLLGVRVRVRIDDQGASAAGSYQAEKRLAALLRVDLARVRLLWDPVPVLLPVDQSEAEGMALVQELAQQGVSAATVEVPAGSLVYCKDHPDFIGAGRCATCNQEVCVFCQRAGAGVCAPCRETAAKKKRNQRAHVAFLLLVLAVVSIFAWREVRRRAIDWTRTQRVAVVILAPDGAPLPVDLTDEFRARGEEVEQALASEAARYLPSGRDPVDIRVFGPVPESRVVPPQTGQGTWDLLRFNLALGSYAEAHDELAGVAEDEFDVRIYLRAKASGGYFESAEGVGQQLGEIGVVNVVITEEGIDFAWFVVLHEFFHTRGATDTYDELGHAKDPEGLADPGQDPLYPQLGTEVMARGRPVSPSEEDLPGAPETWVVGEWTARAIGWMK